MNIQQLQRDFNSIEMSGWLEDWDLENISKYVSALPAGANYLEIGVAYGKSMATACISILEGVNLFGIDLLDWHDKREGTVDQIQAMYGTNHPYTFIQGNSQEIAKTWLPKLNVLFIDGDHTYEGVMKDFASWFPHVAPGGMILFDDYNEATGVKKFIDEIVKDHNCLINHQVDGEMYICQKL
jgi:hypothetical protein